MGSRCWEGGGGDEPWVGRHHPHPDLVVHFGSLVTSNYDLSTLCVDDEGLGGDG